MAEEEIDGNADDHGKHDIPDYILTKADKAFLLAVDRGDVPTVREMLQTHKGKPEELNVNCTDPLMRTGLVTAIENENIELVDVLLEGGCAVQDALLHAISEEFVEAVELLLNWEEEHHVEGTPYSWEAVDRESATFTSDITPLILAAHRNNYEILKTLLDRGATLPMPHDVRCGCDECVQSSMRDSLRHSQARINAYKALSSSSLIALSSKDPILTAFELSWELGRLSRMETEFRLNYVEMRMKTMEFGCSLLDHVRFSRELEVMLNFNPSATTDIWEPGDRQTLSRLRQAIKYKQKLFIAHPNVQQLLAAIWYDGLPGFRRLSMIQQLVEVAKLGAMFPVYSMIYIVSPDSEKGKLCKKPFVQFVLYSASYAFFLLLLAAATQRIEYLALEFIGTPWMLEILEDWKRRERGSIPGPIELFIIMYIGSIVFAEIKSLWDDGIMEYITDLWNIVDFIANFFYVTWIMLRGVAWFITMRESWSGINPHYPREQWDIFDPMLISEGAFAAGMILSFLKLVHIFSINPHLGPLQVSLGRMIIDIIKFFFIYTLVLFAFGCGLNQMLFYYANLEKQKCYPGHTDIPDFDNNEKACSIWRRFANLFETSQSLFWASFGLVDLMAFDLEGIKGFTRFWALLMFGSYSVINIIVLLNMLIAMMSNSYQIISERSDVEWKFARSQLWMSYFEDGNTLPIPFNLCPTIKILRNMNKTKQRTKSFIRKSVDKALKRHDKIMYLLIRRFVTAEQSKREDTGVTEDDIMEVRQDISTLRFELIDILKKNGMNTPDIDQSVISGKKGRQMERRILKDFQIGFVEASGDLPAPGSKDVFSNLAKAMMQRQKSSRDAGGAKMAIKSLSRKNTVSGDPIGSRRTSLHRRSLRRQVLEDANAGLRPNASDLIEFNPQLADVTQATRVAVVKFIAKTIKADKSEISTENEKRPSLKAILHKQKSMQGEKPPEGPRKSSLKTSSVAIQEENENRVKSPEVQRTAETKTSPTLKSKAPEPPKKEEEKQQKSNDSNAGGCSVPTDSDRDGGKKLSDGDSSNGASKEDSKQDKCEQKDEKKNEDKKPEEKDKKSDDKKDDGKAPDGQKSDSGDKKPDGADKPKAPKKKDDPEKRTRAAPVEGTTDRGKSTVTGKTVSGWL